MLILLLEILAVWSALAVVTGFVLAAVIKRAERAHKDVALTCLFATIEALQTSRY